MVTSRTAAESSLEWGKKSELEKASMEQELAYKNQNFYVQAGLGKNHM